MTGPGLGINQAVTQDGEKYNKLRRPDDFILTRSATPPPLKPASVFEHAALEKRKRTGDHALHPNKQTRVDAHESNTHDRHRQTRPNTVRDPATGMLPSVPVVSEGEGSADDSIDEALAYLRSVRSEASAIPHILIAQNPRLDTDHHEGQHQTSLVYEEGTWIALEESRNVDNEHDMLASDDGDLSTRAAATIQLLRRFDILRAKLAVNGKQRSRFDDRPDARSDFKSKFRVESPNMDEIQSLSSRAVFGRIRLCTDALHDQKTSIILPEFSCWIWTLLAMVGDVGTLDNPSVSYIRDIALAASRLKARNTTTTERLIETGISQPIVVLDDSLDDSAEGHAAGRNSTNLTGKARINEDNSIEAHDVQELDPVSDELDEGQIEESASLRADEDRAIDCLDKLSESDASMSLSGSQSPVGNFLRDDDVEQARARLLAQLGDRLVHTSQSEYDKTPREKGESSTQKLGHDQGDLNTMITIDMIVTVAAERFGQKDLLEYRDQW